jgi:RecJ-like exonuclease
VKKYIVCEVCKGNGYVVIARKIIQCCECNSSGHIGETNVGKSVEQRDENVSGYQDPYAKDTQSKGFCI